MKFWLLTYEWVNIMHYEMIIGFLTDHANLICIPLGIALRCLKLLFDRAQKGEKSQSSLLDKTYEHMRELRERGDKAMQDHTNLLSKHNNLKGRHRSLQSQLHDHVNTIKEKDRYIKELEERCAQAELKLVSPTTSQDMENK